MFAGPATGVSGYGVTMAPGGAPMMPNAGMMPPAAYGMPAMYNVQPVCHAYFFGLTDPCSWLLNVYGEVNLIEIVNHCSNLFMLLVWSVCQRAY